MHNTSQIAFIDTETTGLDPELDYVWEIAVIVDDTEHVWQQRLPEFDGMPDWSKVSPWVIENTGIQDRYVHDEAMDPYEGVERFVELVSGRHLVGACPWFDSERLHRVRLENAHFTRKVPRDLPWHYHLIDVETLALGFLIGEGVFELPELPWKSEDLSRMVGVEPPAESDRHSALADARWARDIYEAVFADA